MTTETVLIKKIMSITTLIREKHPELIGFIDEMSETIPDESNPKLNLKTLNDYYNSLTSLLKKYEIEHPF